MGEPIQFPMAGTTAQRAQEVNRALAKNVDVMIGNEEDLPPARCILLPIMREWSIS